VCKFPENWLTGNRQSHALFTWQNKKASIRWQDSAPPISGYWPTSKPNAGYWCNDVTTATLWGEVCAKQVLPMPVGPFSFRYEGNGATPCQYIDWYHLKDNSFRYKFAAESFYIMKLCSTLFVLYCRNCPKDDKWVLYPHFEEVRGGVEPWLMACWKAHVEFLLSVVELLFLSLTVEALQGKMHQNSLPSEGSRSLGAKI